MNMKRCIFCGNDSSCSKSVEHIVPESFGNKSAILRKGIVCDKCNNYFARKVEQPFLESEPIRKLRQELQLENKKGKTIEDYGGPETNSACHAWSCTPAYWISKYYSEKE